jgi:hypothetical protein
LPLFISKLKVLVSSSGIRILKERREETQNSLRQRGMMPGVHLDEA